MRQIQTGRINAIRALLSETQQGEYEKWRAERDAKRKAIRRTNYRGVRA